MNNLIVLAAIAFAAAVLGVMAGGALVWRVSVHRAERVRSDELLHQAMQQLPRAVEQAIKAEVEALATRQAAEERLRSALLERWQSEQSLRLSRHEERMSAALQRHLDAVTAVTAVPAADRSPPVPAAPLPPAPPIRPAADPPRPPRPPASAPRASESAPWAHPPEPPPAPLSPLAPLALPPPPAVDEPEPPRSLHELTDEEIDALPPDLPPAAPPPRRLMRSPPKNTMRSL